MTTPTPSERFLATLAEQLRALGARDADDIVGEIRSHLAENPAAEAEALGALGDPRELAAALLAEREEGARDAGVKPAGATLQAFSWAADAVWAVWPVALAWPLLLIVGAGLVVSPDPLGLALLAFAAPGGAIVTLIALALVAGPLVALVRAARRRGRGLPTLGTRVAGLSAGRSAQSSGWVWATGEGGALPPIPHPVRARVALGFALLAVIAGVTWAPALGQVAWMQSQTFDARMNTDDLRMQLYQAAAEGWTRDLYTAALGGTMSAFIDNGDKGFSAKEGLLAGLASSLKADRVTGWRLGLGGDVSVKLSGDSADVVVPVVEVTPTGERNVMIGFHVVDPQGESKGFDQTWSLTSIDRGLNTSSGK